MSREVYRFRVGQRDLTFIKLMKDNEQIVDTIIRFIPKTDPRINALIYGAQATYKGVIAAAEIYEAKHVCFLINRDLFEYSNKGYERHRDVGRNPEFDWDSLGNALNGTTYVSPDEIERAIINSGKWNGPEYDFKSHNCQDFTQFCMRAAGCPESMIMKKGPVYRSQEKKFFKK